MGKNKTTSLEQFSVKAMVSVFGALLATVIISGAIFTNLRVYAEVTDTVKATVVTSCTLSGVVDAAHTKSIMPGTTEEGIGTTAMTAVCNDNPGFDIYAIGFSGDQWGNTTLVPGTVDSEHAIATGTGTSGDSAWAMQLTKGTATSAQIANGFDSYSAVPSEYTKVAYSSAATTASSGSTLISTYRVHASTTQAADTYSGQVRYTLVHPHVEGTTNAPTAAYTMQEFTYDMCKTLADDADYPVIDARTGLTYPVRYIYDTCWMNQNLVVDSGVKMTAENTNITAAQYNHDTYYSLPASGYDLRTEGNKGVCNNGLENGFVNQCYHIADDTDVTDAGGAYSKTQLGAWYNYAAATAGTITGSENKDDGVYSICPAGWQLPSYNTNPGSITMVTRFDSEFNLVLGGFYKYGSQERVDKYGYWWSSEDSAPTFNNGRYRRTLNADVDNLLTTNAERYYGSYVRCVLIPAKQ